MEEAIEEVKTLLQEHERRISKLEAMSAEPSSEEQKKTRGKKKISLKEFLKEKKPKGYTQTALAIGFYLEKCECLSSFNAKDLENGFTDAKETPPKNLNDTANINVNNRHMMECKSKKDDKKAWVLTRAGEDYVESGFKKEMR
ncbi:MAG: hypothetical protein FVQ85_01535 [Planctomycetes bacterium]|nr:hypothetical protein [Planctomycetota bacterium]